MTEACEMIVALAQELKLTCSTKREAGTCTPNDCENCLTRDLVSAAYQMAGGEREKGKPACQANDEESAELNRELHAAEERVEQLVEALRSVCTELRLERGCYEGECGTDACCYSDCVIGPALNLLESLGREVRDGDRG